MIRDESVDEERGSMLPHDHGPDMELRHLTATEPSDRGDDGHDHVEPPSRLGGMRGRAKTIKKKQVFVWNRFNGVGRKKIGVLKSLRNIATSSCMSY